MSSELLTARNLLSRAAGLLEFHAERGSAVAANLNKEIADFLWPEESRDNPTLESKVIPEGAGSMPAAGRWPPRIALTVERPGPESRPTGELSAEGATEEPEAQGMSTAPTAENTEPGSDRVSVLTPNGPHAELVQHSESHGGDSRATISADQILGIYTLKSLIGETI